MQAKKYLIGLDIGTTGTKCLLFSTDGEIIGHAYEGYALKTPQVGRSEQDANDWWHAVVKTVRAVSNDPKIAQSIVAISLSLQGGTLVPVDESGEPLCQAVVWNDSRATKQAATFKEKFGSDYMYQRSGWNLNGRLNAMQIAWLRENRPEIHARTWKFLSVSDFISLKMTGRAAVDISNVGINQLADIRTCAYDKNILDFIGIKEDQLADIVPSGEPIGHLTPKAAEELALPESVILVAGAHDQYAVSLGAGAVNSGNVLIGSGTAWVVTAITDRPNFDSGLAQSVSAIKGKWGSLLSIGTGGVCLEWFRKNLKMLDDNGDLLSYKAIDEMAGSKEIGANGLFFYPYFGGSSFPERDSVSKASFIGLDLSHERSDIARAIMEGVSYQIVWGLETFRASFPITGLKLAGGASKSALWSQMVADIANLPVRIPLIPDLACVGAAILAGVGIGIFTTAEEGYQRLAIEEKIILPNPENATRYAELFKLFKKHARSLRTLYDTTPENR